jgi:UDP-glucuronate decarboxylase
MSGRYWEPPDIAEIVARLGPAVSAFAGKTIVISGGRGFLGRYFASVLAHLNQHAFSEPCRVVALDNLITSGNGDPLAGLPGVEFLHHDITEPLEYSGDVQYIIHAAGIASPYYYRKFPLETLEVGTHGTKNMLELARKHGAAFLFFSSSEIYGDPDPANVPTAETYWGNVSCLGLRACYDESKRLGETLTRIYFEQFGLPTRIVRPFNVYGPGMQERDYRVLPNFASSIKGGRPLRVYRAGTQTRTFCYVTDAIVGFLLVLLRGRPGEPYNIGNDRPEVSILELVDELQRAVGRELAIERVENPDGIPSDEPMRRCPDLTKSRVHLDYEPQVSLSEGLGRFLRWSDRHYTGQG